MELQKINSPKMIKQLTNKELEILAKDIRKFLIETCAVTGGHIGANLGVVELTLALHKHFDSPTDKLLFDVGHQAYIHKILTGRSDAFHSLRQYKGLCGFPKRNESEHDVWEAGHSSTSLSGAMGMAKARDIMGENYHVVPIIGDGAITGGMALEALNHIGHDQTNMTIILNDNEMSIAPNVGAMHNMFTRLRTNAHYNRFKNDVDGVLSQFPMMRKTADRMKDSVKYFVMDGIFFEELGLQYIGPIDGHSFEELEEAIELSKKTKGPSIIHVITKKGKGFKHAEDDMIGTWHGLGPYKIETGEVIKSESVGKSWGSIISDELLKYASEDRRIVAITPAMPVGSKLTKFQQELPDQFFDVGIAEQHAITMAAGLAAVGMKPFVAIYSTFLQRAYDQLLHDVDRMKLNVIVGIDRAGLVGADGETHQGVFDVSIVAGLPNTVIMMPKDAYEAQDLMKTAIEYNEGPIAIRYPRGNSLTSVAQDYVPSRVEIGTWDYIVEDVNSDVTIITYSESMIHMAIEVSQLLKQDNISIDIVNARFIKPIDKTMMQTITTKTKNIVVIEEVIKHGGLGSIVANYIVDHRLSNVLDRIGIDDEYIEHGDVVKLLSDIGISSEQIAAQIRKMMND